MNPEYVILGAPFWKLWRKKIGLWYAHGSITPFLKIAEVMTNYIFTSTKSGFRLKSEKKKVVGQGIDINKFKVERHKVKSLQEKFKIISVGRISRVKDYKTLILAAEILKKRDLNFQIQILGGSLTKDDEIYFENMKDLVKINRLEKNVEFLGSVSCDKIPDYLNLADVFVNMGKTGSLDKVILEAMASELPILTCNEAVLEILENYTGKLMYPKNDFQKLAEKIEGMYNLQKEKRQKIGKDLRKIVENNHSLKKLIIKILNIYRK